MDINKVIQNGFFTLLLVAGFFWFFGGNDEEKKSNEENTEKIETKRTAESQFSAWDGSHSGLERLIKNNMNDPDSYEHVETRFVDHSTYIYVVTKFRGNNAFGGKVINTVEAKVDFSGNVIEIISE